MQIEVRRGAIYEATKQLGNISRDELARRMGVSTATAFRVEKGDTLPSPKFIAALMSVTGKRFEELFEIKAAA